MDSLVSTRWLADHLGDTDLAVLDASMHLPAAGRDARAEYEAAHIPGARFLDMASFAEPGAAAPNTLPTAGRAAVRLGEMGLTPGGRVVVYDDSMIASAARAWFILTGYGAGRVAILDGGLAKWRAEGRPLESGAVTAATAAFPARPFANPLRDKPAMHANCATRAEQVVDARDAARFAGESVEGGHIPGARNLWFRELFAADGTFKHPEELRALFERAGVDLARPVVTSCNSGITAAVLLFALHLIGKDAALYDGSWSEWSADPAMPREIGPA